MNYWEVEFLWGWTHAPVDASVAELAPLRTRPGASGPCPIPRTTAKKKALKASLSPPSLSLPSLTRLPSTDHVLCRRSPTAPFPPPAPDPASRKKPPAAPAVLKSQRPQAGPVGAGGGGGASVTIPSEEEGDSGMVW